MLTGIHRARAEFLGLAAIIYIVAVLAARHLDPSPLIAAGALADMSVTVPLLSLVILVRRGLASWTLPILLSTGGMTAGLFLIPDPLLGPLAGARHTAWLGLRLLVLGLVAFRAVQALRSLRDPIAGPQPLTAIRRFTGSDPLAHMLLQEFRVQRLALTGWLCPSQVEGLAFTQHRTSSLKGLVITVALLLLAETAGLHLLLERWNPIVAWIATGGSLYALVWLVALYQSARLWPTSLHGDHLHVGAGLRGGAIVARDQIAKVEPVTHTDRRQPDYLHTAILTEPNLLLTLSSPAIAVDLGGRERPVTRIGLYLDDPAAFRRAAQPTTAP